MSRDSDVIKSSISKIPPTHNTTTIIRSLTHATPVASLLKELKHANIVVLHDIIHTKRMLTLVFEYVVSPLVRTSFIDILHSTGCHYTQPWLPTVNRNKR